MAEPYLSVVIPAYNEEDNFRRGVLLDVKNFLVKQKFSWEVILVDDGSTDQTLKLLSEFSKKNEGFRLLNINHGGKLKALLTGVSKAHGQYIVFTDFDQSTPIYEFEKFLPHLKSGSDVIIGSRIGKGSKRINDPFFRYFRSRVLNFIIQLVLFRGIDDTQCGFKIFKKDTARKIFNNLKITHLAKPKGGFMGPFDIELLYLARKFHYQAVSVPVTWHYYPSARLSTFSEPLKFIIDILRIKLFDIQGKYDSAK